MAEAYRIPSVITDGNDALSVYREIKKAADWARSGKGPYLVEATTYRMVGHSAHDEDDYRSLEVLGEWKKKDPILKMEQHLREYGISEAESEAIKNKVKQEVANAYEKAAALPKTDIGDVRKIHESIVERMWGRQ
jgi:TPP-dependent pyruvate/acetoin dehydrogenase alpha subunit